jgi:hypothetical protein
LINGTASSGTTVLSENGTFLGGAARNRSPVLPLPSHYGK